MSDDIDDRAREIARKWLHDYGIDTTAYTKNGGDHPAMASLPNVIASALLAERQKAATAPKEPAGMRSAEEWYAKGFEPAQAESLIDREEMLRFIRAIQNDVLASRTGEGWRPIETARRDGTWLLLRNQTGEAAVGWSKEKFPGNDDWKIGAMCCFRNPTHWMPLPAAPPPPAMEKQG